MKFISYQYNCNENYGILNANDTAIIPMTTLLLELNKEVPKNLLEFIQTYSDSLVEDFQAILDSTKALGDSIASQKDFETIALGQVKITAPIAYPRRNIFCLGKNYADHAVEIKSLPGEKAEVPSQPIYFTKIADPAIGHEDKISISEGSNKQLDYEVELAIIIGKDGKDISPEDSEDYIFGYAIGNDITARDIQKRHIQWFKGKSLDSASPIGPWIVHKSDIPYPVELDISCKVNGEVRQSSNTKNLIFDIPTIISDLSSGLTLRAGDIILTGTPAGVGMGMNPPKFLKSGDVIESYIEKVGSLINYVD